MLSLLLQAALQSPLSPEAELARFRLPPGFSAELVVAEPDVKKIVDIAFDDAGRMWALTASEYPLDGNENPKAAAELYATGGADDVLIFDTPCAEGRQRPRVFASGLAMPMAILPWKNGALVGHGPEILFLDDTDGDGRADRREVVLSGFGIDDSHLLPHRFVRGPGDWIFVAQGAFNHSQVRTKRGEVVPFDQCKLARFKPDGSAFEVIGHGLNNIWGIVLDRSGEMYVQEANDLGYPLVPFFLHASYPGIGDHKHRPYSPWQPALATFPIGGTGLSGLACSEDRKGFPSPWNRWFFVANPITNRVQTISVRREGDVDELALEAELVATDDTWFRPVAIHFGPDGCLYVVDWYNEIISHNEVPRSDPRRDKAKTRVWRIRHEAMARATPPDLTKVPNAELVAHLDADATWEVRAAWHQIVDRRASELAPRLRELVRDDKARSNHRLHALWALEGLGEHDLATLKPLLKALQPALKREAVRAALTVDASPAEFEAFVLDIKPASELRTRLVLLELLTRLVRRADAPFAARALLARTPPPRTTNATTQAYIDFERSLIRAAWESAHETARASVAGFDDVVFREGQRLFAVATGGADGARLLARALERIGDAPTAEELLLCAAHFDVEEARALLERCLGAAPRSAATIDALLSIGARAPIAALRELLVPALTLESDATDAAKDRCVRAASAWKLAELAPRLERLAADPAEPRARRAKALAALVELGRQSAGLCAELARTALPGEELQRTAVLALAALRTDEAAAALFENWRALSPVSKRGALAVLAANDAGARVLLAALERDDFDARELDADLIGRLRAVGEGSTALAALDSELARRAVPTLACFGGGDDGLDTGFELAPPFTVEVWVKLAEPITNADGVLGRAGDADFNFANGRFRFYAGPALGDRALAKRALEPETWTHVAVTCDSDGAVVLYQNAEAEAQGTLPLDARFHGLDVARTTPAEGTHGRFAEFRLWSRAKSARELGEDFRRRTDALANRAGLVRAFSTAADFAPLAGGAKVEASLDAPPVLDAAAAHELDLRFARARSLAARGGDAAQGRVVFERTCMVCHSVTTAGKLEGAKIGPPLDGSAHRGIEGLLRAVVTPSAAVESGYRLLLVETTSGERLDGFLASQDEREIVLRRQDRDDLRLARAEIASLAFDKLSVMPDGLLDGLPDAEVADLFAFLAALR
ncbi:MAG: c-type cytochrome [Planctomycetes bacterium]|nr:c-type cytochrome [Planctomycetota bacterium]